MASALEGMITGWMEVREPAREGGVGGGEEGGEGELEGAIRRRRAAPE